MIPESCAVSWHPQSAPHLSGAGGGYMVCGVCATGGHLESSLNSPSYSFSASSHT